MHGDLRFRSMFLAFAVVDAPVSRYRSSATSTPQTGTTCGAPAPLVVASQ
jgi:hypothetical protein